MGRILVWVGLLVVVALLEFRFWVGFVCWCVLVRILVMRWFCLLLLLFGGVEYPS